MQKAIIDDGADAEISVSMVWINMLPLDSRLAAHVQAQTMPDPRVCHFHDPKRRVGRAVARSLGGQDEVAWDIYLFFRSGGEWKDSPPPPTWWAHQLSGSSWADQAHYLHGDDLFRQLRQAMADLLG